jgi:hypothetical protein
MPLAPSDSGTFISEDRIQGTARGRGDAADGVGCYRQVATALFEERRTVADGTHATRPPPRPTNVSLLR